MQAAWRTSLAQRALLFPAIAALLASCVAEVPILTDADDCGDECRHVSDARPGVLRGHLRDNLRALMDRDATIFGQQRFNLTGVNPDGSQWLAYDGRIDDSNARDLTGSHPGVLGIDVWDLAIKPATWSPSPALHARAARLVFSRGGVVTMEWHMRGCNADDTSGAGFYAAGNEDCLCRLANDDDFAQSWLVDGKLARFADAIEAHGLADVPIVFRPLHEMTGDWFWWGYSYWNCESRVPGATVNGPAAFRRVFRRMVDYLRDERGLDNLLVAYSPDKLDRGVGNTERERYLAGYPCDDWVDVLGIDLYYMANQDFGAQSERYARYLVLVTALARERGKIAALTETGNYRLASESTPSESRWFSDHLRRLLHGNPEIRLAFALTWENRRAAPSNFYVPYPGHPGADDFRAFAAGPGVLMLDELDDLYRPADGDPDDGDPDDGDPDDGDPDDGDPDPDDGDPDDDAPPICVECASDTDGDGWGWEHETSCVVPAWCVNGYPECARCDSDPDHDGWGWENEASCVVPAWCG